MHSVPDSMSSFASNIVNLKYAHTKADGTKETWPEIAHRVAWAVLGQWPELAEQAECLIRDRIFIPGGRYLYACGNDMHQTQNCLLLRADDSREGWAELLYKATMALMTGAGIGVDYSEVRPRGSLIQRTGGTATGPCALMQMLNEAGRGIRQGGDRRSAIWAGLKWSHPDVFEFIALKDWPEEIKALKAADPDFPAPMDGTNISVILDDEFFQAYADASHPKHEIAYSVYWDVVQHMLSTAEPGFSVDVGENAGESLRNACTEVTSRDDSDICNIGSINMARIHSKAEMARATRIGTIFLLAGTLYSHVPYTKVDEVRTKNRRLALGLMGVHEFLLKRGKKYGPDAELGEYLDIYALSGEVANEMADEWGISRPVKTRGLAPNGTIGIVAETTTSGEPLFCVAYKRVYVGTNNQRRFEYVIDPTAKRLIDSGIPAEAVEDAYTLAENPERRVAFQAWLQQWVDHGISSTINLPPWGSPLNNQDRLPEFGEMLMKYLPKLRGITCYPDGCRAGQPLTRVDYATAAAAAGEVFLEAVDVCDLTKGGGCG